MDPIIIQLPPNKYIAEIEPFKSKGLDTDSIYHKEIPGCGITHYAIQYFMRHLVGILPNVPVIESKEAEHNKQFPESKILGVYKGVDVDDIKEYLLSDVEFKKILTTPEGFVDKVVKAFDDINLLYDTFFLLFDECERIITDVSYRGNIAAPIDHFFEFKNKAMVSATVLPFSDERFEGFKHYMIEPTYDYSKPLTLIATNSTITSLAEHLKDLDSNRVCVFFNSTNGIAAMIKGLGIEKDSKVFCAQDSVVKLMSKGIKHASSHFDVADLVKYNFFTSRYFSAIDMKVDFQPDIVMITYVLFAEHSILDPSTEVIQIAGRFRNGINSLTHITNFNPALKSKSEDEAIYYLQGSFDTYKGFVDSYSKATNPGSRDMLKKAIDDSPANAFFENGRVNSFMVDNFKNEERVKGYYQNVTNIQTAYANLSKHFSITFDPDECLLSDEDLLKLHGRITKKERYKIVADLFESWSFKGGRYIFPPEDLKSKFIAKYPEIWEAHIHLTPQQLSETGFALGKIKEAIRKEKQQDLLRFTAPKVYKEFNEYTDYCLPEIREKLSRIYEEEGITKKATASSILFFFDGDHSTSKGEHVYKLKARKNLDYNNGSNNE